VHAKQWLVGAHCGVYVYYYQEYGTRGYSFVLSLMYEVAELSLRTASHRCFEGEHLLDHPYQHFQAASFIYQTLTMLSTSFTAIAALIVASSVHVAATPFDFTKDVLPRLNTRDANLTAAVSKCTGYVGEACNYAPNGEGCGHDLCSYVCLDLFPLLSNCCTDQEGWDLNRGQINQCMFQYAVWTEDSNYDVVSIYPSLTRPSPTPATSTTTYTYTGDSFTSTVTSVRTFVDLNTSTFPIPSAAGATSAAGTNSAATATTSTPPATATTTSGAAGQTNAAASGPTTTNGVDKLAAGNGQQLGVFGAAFVGMISLFLL
jgi:hypothetical protein